MGFFSDIGDFVEGQFENITGQTQADAANRAAQQAEQAQREAIARTEAGKTAALSRLEPFQQVGQRGIDESAFLASPAKQFEFIKNNPFFAEAVQNANRQTQNLAAARGRLSSGDTLEELTTNTFKQALPFIDRQRADINNLLGIGTGLARDQANIETGQATQAGRFIENIGDIQSAGTIGAANARVEGTGNLLNLGGQIAGAFSGIPLPSFGGGGSSATPVSGTQIVNNRPIGAF